MKCENVGPKYICETDLELFLTNVLHILVNNRGYYFSLCDFCLCCLFGLFRESC